MTQKEIIIKQIWTKIFLPETLKEAKYQKYEDIRRFHEIVSEMTARLNGRDGNDLWFCDVNVDEQQKIAQDPKASIEENCCNFLENSLFSPVFFALKMAEELKPVAFNIETYQFELIPI